MRKSVRLCWLILPVLWLVISTGNVSYAQLSLLNSWGGFESNTPSYWTMGNQPSGATLTWATDQFRSMGHSLKIVKPGATTDSAAWVSTNMLDLWSPQNIDNVDILIGGWVRTSGVNVNPATDDQKWYISYSFFDSAGALIKITKLPIDQSVASSTGWVADTNGVGQTILPKQSWKTIIAFVAGKNATGTVWGDDFILVGRTTWAGQDWNPGADMPTGFNYWLPPNGGNDGLLNSGFENTKLTTEAAHSGTSSLKFDLPITRTPHDAWVGTLRAPLDASIHAGDILRISVWIKASGLYPDSARKYPGTWGVGFTPIFYASSDPNSAYNEIGAHDYVFTFPDTNHAFDWTQYTLDITVPSDPGATNLSVRIHPYSTMVGTLYFDDLKVEKLVFTNVTGINAVGGFESNTPSYWTMGNQPSGATLTWATDQFRSMGHSLKIVKPGATTDSAAWVSTNMLDLWSPQNIDNVDILIGGWVRTSGVNVNPATDDQKWYISYSFFDSAGALIKITKLPIDQSVASSTGWVADTNGVGQTILPKQSWKTIIAFVAGKNATGTVWGDDFILVGRTTWAGQDWNPGADMPTGFNYWLPPNGGNDGLLNSGFENTKLTTEAAHSGTSSLKFDLPITRTPHDAWVGTLRYPLDAGVQAGSTLRLSVWIKASGLYPDSARKYPGTWGVGFTPIFYASSDPNSAYNEIGAHDYVFTFPDTNHAFDWTQYTLDITVPDDPNAKNLSVRIHPYSTMVGTLYFDDLQVQLISATGIKGAGNIIPVDFNVSQNYPNPFNPSTSIRYTTPQAAKVSVRIYNMLGEEVKTLFSGDLNAGVHNVIWNGDNNSGSKVASGTYIYLIKYNDQFQAKKMILLK